MSDTEYIPSTWDMAADHVERYLASDGDDGYEFHGAECVVLTTRGRRTGAIRRSPLIRVRDGDRYLACLLYTSPSPRDLSTSRMPSSA